MKKITRDDKLILDQFNGVSDLVFWSFRYFLGRRTAATPDFARRLAKIYPILDGHSKAAIRRELEEAYREAERIPGSKPLGDPCDRQAWDKVRKAYQIEPGGFEL
jgi:hypothetical protein